MFLVMICVQAEPRRLPPWKVMKVWRTPFECLADPTRSFGRILSTFSEEVGTGCQAGVTGSSLTPPIIDWNWAGLRTHAGVSRELRHRGSCKVIQHWCPSQGRRGNLKTHRAGMRRSKPRTLLKKVACHSVEKSSKKQCRQRGAACRLTTPLRARYTSFSSLLLRHSAPAPPFAEMD